MKINLIKSVYLTLVFVAIKIKCDCSMMQNCTIEEENLPSCQPDVARGNLTIPGLNHVPVDENLCPEYQDIPVCCSATQIRKIQTNFNAIESIFGSSIGGCDICVTNLKRFWCHFTCHPNQSDFLEALGKSTHIIGNKELELLDLKFHLNEQMNCELFKSCQKTKFAAQVPAMGNAVGFTTFQGVNAYTKIAVFIEIIIEKEKGLTYEIDPCDTEPNEKGEVRGIKIDKTCSCNSCSLKCDYKLTSTTPILEGLNWLIVGIFYLFVIIATVVIFFAKKYVEKNSEVIIPNVKYNDDDFLDKYKAVNVSVSSNQS